MSKERNFVINKGVLIKYLGSDGDVVIPDGVITVRYCTFKDCTNLKSVTIPDSVTGIGEGAFRDCIGLTSVTIPDSVAVIGSGAFLGCKGLADNRGFVIVRDVLYGYYGSESDVSISHGITAIDGFAFRECTGLTSVIIPDSVTSIRGSAFSGCTILTSVTIPGSITAIADEAFLGCSQLTIHAPAGSYAETYAKNHSIPFAAQ